MERALLDTLRTVYYLTLSAPYFYQDDPRVQTEKVFMIEAKKKGVDESLQIVIGGIKEQEGEHYSMGQLFAAYEQVEENCLGRNCDEEQIVKDILDGNLES